jgi:hypothetical protein
MSDVESPLPTDWLVLRCTLPTADGLVAAALAWCQASALTLHRLAWNAELGAVVLYAHLPERRQVAPRDTAPLAAAWQSSHPHAQHTRISRLQTALDAPGVPINEKPAYHYIVETDPEEGWADEIFRWYDTEHMPGLAAVPGCVQAWRLLNHDAVVVDAKNEGKNTPFIADPYSFSCYDLVSTEALISAPWLAVRHTAWSDIARPHFTHTRRTVFEVLV